MATVTLHPNSDLSPLDNTQEDDDVQEMRKALASAQAESRLAAQIGQELVQQKNEFREKARQETRELKEELKSVRESMKELHAQLKVEKEQNLILRDNIQQLETEKEEKATEIEMLKIKVQSTDLERKKALDDQERLIADLDAAEEDLLRLRRVELSLREERDRIQDKLDETRMSIGRNDEDFQTLMDELEELRPLRHIVERRDVEIRDLQDLLKEEQRRCDDAIAESGVERNRLQQTIDSLTATLAEIKTKNLSALSATASKALGPGMLSAGTWGEVSSGNLGDWSAGSTNGHGHAHNLPNGHGHNLPNSNGLKLNLNLPPPSSRGLGESVGHGASEEHGGDNCPCGAEHIQHVLAHTKRPQLRVCETCTKHFCRRCSAYQIYGMEYRQIDSRLVINCYKCWIANGGSLAEATEALARAAAERGAKGGLWREDSNASFFSDAGSEHGGSRGALPLLAKVRGFISGAVTPR